jgi:hypothetical protein
MILGQAAQPHDFRIEAGLLPFGRGDLAFGAPVKMASRMGAATRTPAQPSSFETPASRAPQDEAFETRGLQPRSSA